MTVLRWGIVSAGKISHDFVVGLGTLPADEHKVVAVAARDVSRAKEFAKLHEIPTAYGSYEELAKNPEIDIIYVGNLNPDHLRVSKLMLEHGKHVLCEKPLCMNQKQAKELIEYAKSKKLFLMEAIWSRFFPAYQHVKNQILSGALGEIKEVKVNFGFNLSGIDRLEKKNLGGGTVLDLGVYAIQVTQWAFRQPPTAIKAKGVLNEDGVDVKMEAELHYPNGGVARISTNSQEEQENKAYIIGTKGTIVMNNFWSCTSLVDVDGTEKSWPLPAGKHDTFFRNSVGLRYEAIESRRLILEDKLESEDVSHNESLIIAHIQDEIRRQIGVVFQEDLQ